MLTRYNFCKPELTAHVSYSDHMTSICPSVNNSHFRLSKTAAGISTKLHRKQVPKVVSQVCSFWADPPGDVSGGLGPRRVPSLKKKNIQNQCMI